MESSLTHLFHAAIIAVVMYLVMTFVLKQSSEKAMTRSLFIGAVALIYMILFGHGLPGRVHSI